MTTCTAMASKNLEDNTFDMTSWKRSRRWRRASRRLRPHQWCGSLECELAMKEKAGVSGRCMPLKASPAPRAKCVVGAQARHHRHLLGRGVLKHKRGSVTFFLISKRCVVTDSVILACRRFVILKVSGFFRGRGAGRGGGIQRHHLNAVLFPKNCPCS